MAYEADVYGEEGGFEEEDDDDERKEIERASWMCCLFTALALGSSTAEDNEAPRPSEYFSSAKALSRALVEDESIQSIQALLLMVHIHLLLRL